MAFLLFTLLFLKLINSGILTPPLYRTTPSGYLYTNIIVGIPNTNQRNQVFQVLIDSINNSSTSKNTPLWILSQEALPLNYNKMGGYNVSWTKNHNEQTIFIYNYIYTAKPSLILDSQINSISVIQDNIIFEGITTPITEFGLYKSPKLGYDFYINQTINGVIIIDNSNNSILALMKQNNAISTKKLLYDGSSSLKLGDYSLPTISTSTYLNIIKLTKLENLWIFSIAYLGSTNGINLFGGGTNKNCSNCYGIIDLGNANIGYGAGSTGFSYLSAFGVLFPNCDYKTSTCPQQPTPNNITILTKNGVEYIIYGIDMYNSVNNYVKFDERYSIDDNNFIYLGLPFLKNYYIELDSENNKIGIMTPGTVTYSHWKGVIITLSIVIIVAALLFGIFFYFNKIPAAQRVGGNDAENQSLLRGQAVGVGQVGGQNDLQNMYQPSNYQQQNISNNDYDQIFPNENENDNYINQNQMLIKPDNNNNNNNNNNNTVKLSKKENNENQSSGRALGGSNRKLTPQEIKAQRLAKLQANLAKQENDE